jgi:hypothetical protein
MAIRERYQVHCRVCVKAFEAESLSEAVGKCEAHEAEMAEKVPQGLANPRTHAPVEFVQGPGTL